MKLIRLYDEVAIEYWINPDQICALEHLPRRSDGKQGCKMRINGFSRALKFKESAEELDKIIRDRQMIGGSFTVHHPRTPPPPVSVRELGARGIVGYRHDRKVL